VSPDVLAAGRTGLDTRTPDERSAASSIFFDDAASRERRPERRRSSGDAFRKHTRGGGDYAESPRLTNEAKKRARVWKNEERSVFYVRREGETSRRRRGAATRKNIKSREDEFADENRGARGGPRRLPPLREERTRACRFFRSVTAHGTERNGHDTHPL